MLGTSVHMRQHYRLGISCLSYIVNVSTLLYWPEEVVVAEYFPSILELAWLFGAACRVLHGAEREVNEAFPRRRELPQLYTTLGEDLCRLRIDRVSLIINHLADADLGDLDAACQARACVAVEGRSRSNSVTTSFQERILFGVEAKAGC